MKLITTDDFKSQIGKRIYRTPSDCCDTCRRVSEEGLIVENEQHASYLSMYTELHSYYTSKDEVNEGL